MNWAPSSEFVSSSIPSWQILTMHAQPFRGARDLLFCLKVPLDSLLVWASSEGSGETARMRRLAWTFAARISDKYQIRWTRSNYYFCGFYLCRITDKHSIKPFRRYSLCEWFTEVYTSIKSTKMNLIPILIIFKELMYFSDWHLVG